MTVSAFWPFTLIFSLCLSPPPFLFWSHPVLTFTQAIPSLGFHQFKSNSLDVLQRRIEELQVCPSVRCPSCLIVLSHCPLLTSSSHFVKCKCMIKCVLDSHFVALLMYYSCSLSPFRANSKYTKLNQLHLVDLLVYLHALHVFMSCYVY